MEDFIRNGLILILSSVSGLLLAPAEQSQAEKPQEKVCRATSMGSPCPQGGVATLGLSRPGPDHGTGNPIDLRSGNKYQRETDLPRQASGLELVRHYNAMDPRTSALGRGWSWSYDTQIYAMGEQLQVVQADASRLVFQCTLRQCVSDDKMYGEIHRKENGWLWFWPTGKRLHFDQRGKLIRITSGAMSQSLVIVIERHPEHSKLSGEINRIRADKQELTFDYEKQGVKPSLQAVHTSRGTFNYSHDIPDRPDMPETKETRRARAPRLVRVKRPDGMLRIYHYDRRLQTGHAYALTGISIRHNQSEVRTHSWRYDKTGRANVFVSGPPEAVHQLASIPFDQALPELKTKRDQIARIRAIEAYLLDWPGLSLRFDAHGDVSAWSMRGLGLESWTYDPSISSTNKDRVVVRRKKIIRSFADQSTWQWDFDRHQRIVSMDARQPGRVAQRTRIDWRSSRPVVIEHPEETQIMRYGRHTSHPSLLSEREVHRPSRGTRAAWSYRERFRYNEQGQVREHFLPEGGRLHYWWNDNRLLSIHWQDPQGLHHPVIDTTAAGIRHGNGLVTSALQGRSGLTDLILYQPLTKTALFHQQLAYNTQGVMTNERIRNGIHRVAWRHRRDWRGRLLPQPWPMVANRVLRDVTGLPSRVEDYVLEYSVLRRLQQVTRLSEPTFKVTYAHNATGERIWRDDGVEQTHYLFDRNKAFYKCYFY